MRKAFHFSESGFNNEMSRNSCVFGLTFTRTFSILITSPIHIHNPWFWPTILGPHCIVSPVNEKDCRVAVTHLRLKCARILPRDIFMMRIDMEECAIESNLSLESPKEIECVFDSQPFAWSFSRRILSFRWKIYRCIYAMGSLFDTHARNHSLTHKRTLAHSGMPLKPCQ